MKRGPSPNRTTEKKLAQQAFKGSSHSGETINAIKKTRTKKLIKEERLRCLVSIWYLAKVVGNHITFSNDILKSVVMVK